MPVFVTVSVSVPVSVPVTVPVFVTVPVPVFVTVPVFVAVPVPVSVSVPRSATACLTNNISFVRCLVCEASHEVMTPALTRKGTLSRWNRRELQAKKEDIYRGTNPYISSTRLPFFNGAELLVSFF